jgi:hypothetical protein
VNSRLYNAVAWASVVVLTGLTLALIVLSIRGLLR